MIGSDFYKQTMLNAGRMLRGTEPYNIPFNELDRCAMEHDAIFARNNNTEKDIRDADIKFRECTSKIKDPKLLYYATIQASQSLIKTKEFSEDIGIISPDLFANINRSIDNLNITLAKNHTIPSTKEEQQQEDSNFYIATLLLFFRGLGVNVFLRGAKQIGTRELFKRTKDLKNLINYFPNNRIISFISKVVNFLMNYERVINKQIVEGSGQMLVNYLLKETDFFGSGITGNVLQAYAEKIGYDKIANYIMDNYLIRLGTSWVSDSWRERNIMTREELEKIINGEDPEIFRANAQRETVMTNLLGFGLRNSRIVEIINLFKNIENLTNRQKIERFGNFYRAIIKIRNKKPDSLLVVIYLLLTGSHAREFVGDITLEKLREILNLKLNRVDIDALLSRSDLIRKLDIVYISSDIDELFLRQYTYMQLIDEILDEFTTKGLRQLLS